MEDANQGRCAYCQTELPAEAEVEACPACQAPHHLECWRENGGCAVYGCIHMPTAQKYEELEIPDAWWGQEHKACPACGEHIKASAVRCRHCETVFATARPRSHGEWAEENRRRENLPALRRQALWVSFLCFLPFLAPLAGPAGLVWYLWARRRGLRQLGGTLASLPLIAVLTAWTMIILFVLAVLAHAVWASTSNTAQPSRNQEVQSSTWPGCWALSSGGWRPPNPLYHSGTTSSREGKMLRQSGT